MHKFLFGFGEFFGRRHAGLDRLDERTANDKKRQQCAQYRAQLLDEGIAYRAKDIDVVWTSGYGFPRHLGGPMFYGDTLGLAHVLERVDVMSPEGPMHAYVLATNVYHKTPKGWRMVVHHASPGTRDEAHEILQIAQVLH